MPNPARTWTITINNAFSSGVDQAVQFSEMFLAIVNLFIAAGWTVRMSSNGVVADLNNNITVVGSVQLGTANYTTRALTSRPSYIVFRSPLGWLPSNQQVEALFCVNNTDPDTTPQTAPIVLCSGVYTLNGTPLDNLPTFTGVETTVTAAGDDIIPWAAAVPGTFILGRTSRGDLFYMAKANGISGLPGVGLLVSQTDISGQGRGNFRFGFFCACSTTTTIVSLSQTNLINSSLWKGFDSSGTNLDSPVAGTAASPTAAWTNGLDFTGEMISAPIDMYGPAAGRGRFMGTILDFEATSVNLAFGVLDDAETAQVYRRFCGGNGVLFYVPTASLPFV